jgi:hypothetical protein
MDATLDDFRASPDDLPVASEEWTPEDIRKLRAERSRPVFARLVGVTPNTVYRWELPPGAPEARRPRRGELVRLRSLAAGARVDVPQGTSSAAPPPPADADVEADTAFAGLARLFAGDVRAADAELTALLARDRPSSPSARALLAVGLGLSALFLRSDARGALASLSPALADAREGRLRPYTRALVLASAACAYAIGDLATFDPGRVQVLASLAESAVSASESPDAIFLARYSVLVAGITTGEVELGVRGFVDADPAKSGGLSPIFAAHRSEALALLALVRGQTVLASSMFDEVLVTAEKLGCPPLLARALGFVATRRLEANADPEAALALARRARSVETAARLAAGTHTLLALRAEIEALLRLARIDEARAVQREVETFVTTTGFPNFITTSSEARLFYLTGAPDELDRLAERFATPPLPALAGLYRAHRLYVEAIAALARCEDPLATDRAVERAWREAGGWHLLLRHLALYAAIAALVAGDDPKARDAVDRAERYLDASPSAWASAHMKRTRALLHASRGDWPEAEEAFEASIAAFELAGDVSDALLSRHARAAFREVLGEPGAVQEVAGTRARLSEVGLRPPRPLELGLQRFKNRAATANIAPTPPSTLAVAVDRLAVRGITPSVVERELSRVLADLLPGRGATLEEVGAHGAVKRCPAFAAKAARDGAEDAASRFEFGDGAGRRLRLVVAGPLGADERSAVGVLVSVAGLALEVATLRAQGVGGSSSREPADKVGLPGVIAASPSMQKLEGELRRLASSRATVIITGESGVGKEVAARALHDLGDRKDKPFVAFNCAAIPRELFEAELFGYRRGSFTGATSDAPGVIRAADGGTLLLDEIGELPLELQPKLLRFLENGEVAPIGVRKPIHVDVRVVAATHRDLASLVREGRFREDLYYRLHVVPLRIAPLRDRKEDILPLARSFAGRLTGGAGPAFAPDAVRALLAHAWPGNVRELRNVIERALAFAPGAPVLRAEHVVFEPT